jgi:hypothetical protein
MLKFGIFQQKLKGLATINLIEERGSKGLFVFTELVSDYNLNSVDVR